MRLADDVGVDVLVDVGTRYRVEILLVPAEVIDTGRRPPEAERVRVLAGLLAVKEVTRGEDGLRRFELVV